MSDLMRDIFEKEWDLPSEAQGLRFIPELNIYGCDLYKNKEAADRKSSAWFYFQKAWKASRECLVIELPKTKEIMPLSLGMYVHEIRKIVDENKYTRAIDLARCAIHAAGVKTK